MSALRCGQQGGQVVDLDQVGAAFEKSARSREILDAIDDPLPVAGPERTRSPRHPVGADKQVIGSQPPGAPFRHPRPWPEHPANGVGAALAGEGGGRGIEGQDDRTAACPADAIHDGIHGSRTTEPANAVALEFDKRSRIGMIVEYREHLFERRNTGAPAALGSDPDAVELIEVHIGDAAGISRQPPEIVVVNDHGTVIGGQLHIELDPPGTGFQHGTDAFETVFGESGRPAAVGDQPFGRMSRGLHYIAGPPGNDAKHSTLTSGYFNVYSAGMPAMESRYFECNGCRLFYRRWPGERAQPTLVMLHGLASNSTRWRELAEQTSAQIGWQVLCPDLRGHRHSVFRGRLDIGDWVADLVAMLDDAGCERAVIGGHCLGANLALRFALDHPGRVGGVVLVEPMLPGALRGVLRAVRPARWLLPVLAWPVRLLNALGIHRRSLPRLDLTELDRHTRMVMAEHGDSGAILKRYGTPGRDMLYMPVATYLQALYQVLRNIGPIDRLQAPALALLSNGALLADPARTRTLLAAVPDIRIEQFDALHWIPTEQPQAMAEAIERFLQQCP